MTNKKRILFLCTGNSARSQMAEAFLNRWGSNFFDAFSAGLEPRGIHPLTLLVMNEAGFSLAGHTSKGVEIFLSKVFIHHLITVCDHAENNCPSTWPGLVEREHWSFEDPAGFSGTPDEQLAKFREVRDQIRDRVQYWLAEQAGL